MKSIFLLLFSTLSLLIYAQPAKNIIIITTDGVRWQEIFKGMDTAIANDPSFNERDSAYIFEKYWAENQEQRRQKLLPFLWSTVKEKGQLYGNRTEGCKVNNANPYWFSYPGYSEIMTGYADTAINSNSYPPNPNVTVLEFLNNQPGLKGKVAVFGAWNAFDRILNEERSKIPVFSAFDPVGGSKPTANEKIINALMQDSYKPWLKDECLDVFTNYAAFEWLRARKPRVIYIAFGETDEWAHAGKYRSYLDAVHQVDAWIKDIWNFIQNDPQYKNNTAFFITTDHGRGDIDKKKWTDHGQSVEDASEIWFAVLGQGVKSKGEVKTVMQLYQQQFAQTIAKLLGYTFTAGHPIADPVTNVIK
jgi:hypothetical protein